MKVLTISSKLGRICLYKMHKSKHFKRCQRNVFYQRLRQLELWATRNSCSHHLIKIMRNRWLITFPKRVCYCHKDQVLQDMESSRWKRRKKITWATKAPKKGLAGTNLQATHSWSRPTKQDLWVTTVIIVDHQNCTELAKLQTLEMKSGIIIPFWKMAQDSVKASSA